MIETSRLRLRRLTVADAPFILELLNDKDFLRYIGDRGVRTLEQAREYIERGPMHSYAEFGIGLLHVGTKTGASVGLCGLLQREFLPDPDLGFALLPAFRGLGFCLEAARAVISDSSARRFDRISAIVQPDNAASIGILGKLGFAYERRFKVAADAAELFVYRIERAQSHGA